MHFIYFIFNLNLNIKTNKIPGCISMVMQIRRIVWFSVVGMSPHDWAVILTEEYQPANQLFTGLQLKQFARANNCRGKYCREASLQKSRGCLWMFFLLFLLFRNYATFAGNVPICNMDSKVERCNFLQSIYCLVWTNTKGRKRVPRYPFWGPFWLYSDPH